MNDGKVISYADLHCSEIFNYFLAMPAYYIKNELAETNCPNAKF